MKCQINKLSSTIRNSITRNAMVNKLCAVLYAQRKMLTFKTTSIAIRSVPIKRCVENLLVKRINVCTTKDHTFFSRRDKGNILKIHFNRVFFSRTFGFASTKFCKKDPWVKGIDVCSNRGAIASPF